MAFPADAGPETGADSRLADRDRSRSQGDTMSQLSIERRRTGWDVVLGILVVLAGLVILGHTVIATVVSVLFLGWVAVITGVVALVASIFRIGRGGFWPTALTGGLLLVIGLMLLRRPGVGALTLTLLAGSLFLAAGITRIVAAADRQGRAGRGLLLFNGIVSTLLGLIVLFNIWGASLTLLGVLLGVETLVDGVNLLLYGRIHTDVRPLGADRREATAR